MPKAITNLECGLRPCQVGGKKRLSLPFHLCLIYYYQSYYHYHFVGGDPFRWRGWPMGLEKALNHGKVNPEALNLKLER